jgi:hypothetical protein
MRSPGQVTTITGVLRIFAVSNKTGWRMSAYVLSCARGRYAARGWQLTCGVLSQSPTSVGHSSMARNSSAERCITWNRPMPTGQSCAHHANHVQVLVALGRGMRRQHKDHGNQAREQPPGQAQAQKASTQHTQKQTPKKHLDQGPARAPQLPLWPAFVVMHAKSGIKT